MSKEERPLLGSLVKNGLKRLGLNLSCRIWCRLREIGSHFSFFSCTHTCTHSAVKVSCSVGVFRMQRNFEPMKKQVESSKGTRLPDETAKLVIYRAFVAGELDAPKHLVCRVHVFQSVE